MMRWAEAPHDRERPVYLVELGVSRRALNVPMAEHHLDARDHGFA
jgi:hypothetical protein